MSRLPVPNVVYLSLDMYLVDSPPNALNKDHYSHLLQEGFTPDEIAQLEGMGVKSISKTEALHKGIKIWDGEQHRASGGIYFPFTQTYGQIRADDKLINAKGKSIKYLGPSASVKAWTPEGWECITEGFKDAAKPTLMGIPTAAVVGVWNVKNCIPKGCGKPIIFDADGWVKPHVMAGLIEAAIWTGGKINLVPPMEDYPKGGLSEFFKVGNTISDYRKLIDDALEPIQLIEKWIEGIPNLESEITKAEAIDYVLKSIEKLNHASEYLAWMESRVDE